MVASIVGSGKRESSEVEPEQIRTKKAKLDDDEAEKVEDGTEEGDKDDETNEDDKLAIR